MSRGFVMGLFGVSVRELHARGLKYYYDGQYDLAIKDFNEALKKEPNNATIHTDLGITYFWSGRRDAAFKEYQTALMLEPCNAKARFGLSYYYLQEDAYDDAIRESNKVLGLNASDVTIEAHITLSICYLNKGQYDDVIFECREAIKLDPTRLEPHDCLGTAFYRKGLYKEALVEYNQALRLKPDDQRLMYSIRLSEERLHEKLSTPQQNGPVIIQKEIIREIVKVPCQYCGTLIEVTASKCPGCGAPLSIHQ